MKVGDFILYEDDRQYPHYTKIIDIDKKGWVITFDAELLENKYGKDELTFYSNKMTQEMFNYIAGSFKVNIIHDYIAHNFFRKIFI